MVAPDCSCANRHSVSADMSMPCGHTMSVPCSPTCTCENMSGERRSGAYTWKLSIMPDTSTTLASPLSQRTRRVIGGASAVTATMRGSIFLGMVSPARSIPSM